MVSINAKRLLVFGYRNRSTHVAYARAGTYRTTIEKTSEIHDTFVRPDIWVSTRFILKWQSESRSDFPG